MISPYKFITELAEVLALFREYIRYVSIHPKSKRDDVTEAILHSYEFHLSRWFIQLIISATFFIVVQLLIALLIVALI